MKRKILVGILTIIMLCVLAPMAVFAAPGTYQDVTVTATPAFYAIDCSQLTWTINGITGGGVIATSTTYYSNALGDTTVPTNPVAADEGYFPIVNTSTINITLTVDMEDFAGGDANMTNGETGSAGATSYGAYSWYEGQAYPSTVIVKKNATGSAVLWTSGTPGDDIDLGITIATQTTAWAGGSSSTATMKITAAPA